MRAGSPAAVGALRAVFVFVGLVLGTGSCDNSGQRMYKDNDLQLLTSYAAKEICSCVFVMGRDDDFCGAWAEQDPNVRTYQIDHAKKTVTSQAILFWGRGARFAGNGLGCVLDP